MWPPVRLNRGFEARERCLRETIIGLNLPVLAFRIPLLWPIYRNRIQSNPGAVEG